MLNIKRRAVLGGLGMAAWGGLTAPAWAQMGKPAVAAKSRAAIKLAPRLRIVIPANAGGGWDQTGRALGAALVGAGMAGEIGYGNKG